MKSQVASFLHYLREVEHYADNTLAAYSNDLLQFVEFATRWNDGSIQRWSQVTVESINDYIDFLLAPPQRYRPTTVTRKIATLKSLFNYITRETPGHPNPTKNLPKLRVIKQMPYSLSADEIKRLLTTSAQDQTPKGLRNQTLLHLLYATGMRVSEAIALRLESLDLDAKTIECGESLHQRRNLPLEDEMVNLLRRYLKYGRAVMLPPQDERALFLNHRGHPLTRQGLWLIVKTCAEKAGFDSTVTPHVLRHSFAVHYLEAGNSLQDLQQRLGHANSSTTSGYTRKPDDDPPDDNSSPPS